MPAKSFARRWTPLVRCAVLEEQLAVSEFMPWYHREPVAILCCIYLVHHFLVHDSYINAISTAPPQPAHDLSQPIFPPAHRQTPTLEDIMNSLPFGVPLHPHHFLLVPFSSTSFTCHDTSLSPTAKAAQRFPNQVKDGQTRKRCLIWGTPPPDFFFFTDVPSPV